MFTGLVLMAQNSTSQVLIRIELGTKTVFLETVPQHALVAPRRRLYKPSVLKPFPEVCKANLD
jgi:hypothetical protein